MKQSVKVEIGGQPLTIRSDEGPQYVEALAQYVDDKLREMAPGGRTAGANLQRMALLVAVQLADELFREKDLHRQFREKVNAKLAVLDAALVEHERRLGELEPAPLEAPSAGE